MQKPATSAFSPIESVLSGRVRLPTKGLTRNTLFFLFIIRDSPSFHSQHLSVLSVLQLLPPPWGAADAEIKVPSVENTELKRSPLKPGVGQYIAIHATLTARDFFLANFYFPVHSPALFSKTSPELLLFFCVSCDYHWFLCRPAE